MRIFTSIRVCIQIINTHTIVRMIAHIVEIHERVCIRKYKYSYTCMYKI